MTENRWIRGAEVDEFIWVAAGNRICRDGQAMTACIVPGISAP
jgi:hypothetical protein